MLRFGLGPSTAEAEVDQAVTQSAAAAKRLFGPVAPAGLGEDAMIHFHFIGYLDPGDPIDVSERPARPKPTRELTLEAVVPLIRRFDISEEEVFDHDGYLVSHLGSFGVLHPFEAELVSQGCVILTEMLAVVQPPEAVERYYGLLARWAEQRASDLGQAGPAPA